METNKFTTHGIIPKLLSKGLVPCLILDSPPLTGSKLEDWNNPVILDDNGMVICHYITPFKGPSFWTFHKTPIGPESTERISQAVRVDLAYLTCHALFSQFD